MGGSIDFLKVEGLGNDFVLVDVRAAADWRERASRVGALAPELCARRRGVGADGLLIVTPGEGEAVAGMIVINHDGSRPEMCGNGLRCAALVVGPAGGAPFVVRTDAGPRRCKVEARAVDGRSGAVTIEMGAAIDGGICSPVSGEGHVFRVMSMGNPHAVAFVGASDDPEALARTLGPLVEVDPRFPRRTNVEFARIDGPRRITLWVWERGVGITEACGTGACATAAAARLAGLVEAEAPICVELPGGALTVSISAKEVVMQGPARVAFAGSWSA